ncbi:MAG: hypothetical protein DRP02_01785 [Candidatus Gerdarchaeota archaeon]|nr:MAG: hypothetical protein DRO63_03300 [Candidatus Gerdarchaeota archaeon]RLI72366.1 MAG: hypothetical protein DRP02_01785 [Candidatus Gerdarchaeota archaeon]
MALASISILVLAIVLQLIAASVNFIGMTIQKKAATELPLIVKEAGILASLKNMITNKAWIFGFLLNSSSTLFAAGAFALASITVLQPLYGFGLIVLVIFIHFYLKEKINRLDIVGVFFGIVGIVVIGITAKPLEQISYLTLITLFTSRNGIIFFSVFLSIALLSYLVSEKTKKTISLVFLVISSAIWTATQNLFTKAVATAIRDVGFIEAFFGERWLFTWTFVLLYFFVSVIGIILLNISYQKGQGVIILPIWAAIQVIIPVLAGIIIFQEWAPTSGYSILDIILQSIGIVIMLVSIITLSINNGWKEKFAEIIKAEASAESHD